MHKMPSKDASQKANEKALHAREKEAAEEGHENVGGGKVDQYDHTPKEAGSDVDLRQMTGVVSDEIGDVAKKTIVTDEDGKSTVKKSKPINVVAVRPGYYKQERKMEGDKFTIEGEHQMGEWMKKI